MVASYDLDYKGHAGTTCHVFSWSLFQSAVQNDSKVYFPHLYQLFLMIVSYWTEIVCKVVLRSQCQSKAPSLVFCLQCNAEEVTFKSNCGECFLTNFKRVRGGRLGKLILACLNVESKYLPSENEPFRATKWETPREKRGNPCSRIGGGNTESPHCPFSKSKCIF